VCISSDCASNTDTILAPGNVDDLTNDYAWHDWGSVSLSASPQPSYLAASYTWYDQGWGNYKGYWRICSGNSGGCAQYGVAPHSSTSVTNYIGTGSYPLYSWSSGDTYTLQYYVGGGGGHELFINNMVISVINSATNTMEQELAVEDLHAKADTSAAFGEELAESKPCDYKNDWAKHTTYDYKCDFGNVLRELDAGLYNNTDGTLTLFQDAKEDVKVTTNEGDVAASAEDLAAEAAGPINTEEPAQQQK
jgi:hypothetical protein